MSFTDGNLPLHQKKLSSYEGKKGNSKANKDKKTIKSTKMIKKKTYIIVIS